jgi:transposase
MSQKEFQRVKVIENAAGGRLSVGEAPRLLQLSERQVQRLKRRYRPDSVGWVQHRNRGRSMPWTVSLPQKQLSLSLAPGKYLGFQRFSSDGKTSPRGEPLRPARLAELIPLIPISELTSCYQAMTGNPEKGAGSIRSPRPWHSSKCEVFRS